MLNVQHRVIHASAAEVGAIIDRVTSPDESVWPAAAWPPLVLDRGLVPGSRGGHGPIRYHLTEYKPGRRILFAFEPHSGLDGHHELTITPEGPDRCRLTHTIDSATRGRMRILWPTMVRWLHEALMRDLLDNAERAATGRLSGPPARWSPWVRLLRRTHGAKR
ncbi:SRPBCC family protein [Nonomuraea sp. NPDC049152]|uniref:SRPBCC family protein n=1 Tax=Nonomuraea sp. NPDC049152 TaxID=3154350 RepID=UPI0033DC78D4